MLSRPTQSSAQCSSLGLCVALGVWALSACGGKLEVSSASPIEGGGIIVANVAPVCGGESTDSAYLCLETMSIEVDESDLGSHFSGLEPRNLVIVPHGTPIGTKRVYRGVPSREYYARVLSQGVRILTEVPSAGDCENARNGGWHYDGDTPGTLAFHLCPCDSYEAIASGAVVLLLLNQCEEFVEVL